MYHGCSKPLVGKCLANSVEDSLKEKRQSALKLAVIEFAVVFVSEVGWNLVRKTGQSTIDAFGIALLTVIRRGRRCALRAIIFPLRDRLEHFQHRYRKSFMGKCPSDLPTVAANRVILGYARMRYGVEVGAMPVATVQRGASVPTAYAYSAHRRSYMPKLGLE